MSWRRYQRLTLVLLVPLLLAGWLLGRAAESRDHLFVTCEESSTFENCRNVGWNGGLHDYVVKSHSAWFDIQLPDSETSSALPFSGSRRSFFGAEIVSAEPFVGNGPDAATLMSGLVGKRARVVLGVLQDERSNIFESGADLACNSLTFSNTSRLYQANCYGDAWSGPVTFKLAGTEQRRIESLRRAMQDETENQRHESRLFQLIVYPIFVYIFFVGSALAWLAVSAYRYVKAA